MDYYSKYTEDGSAMSQLGEQQPPTLDREMAGEKREGGPLTQAQLGWMAGRGFYGEVDTDRGLLTQPSPGAASDDSLPLSVGCSHVMQPHSSPLRITAGNASEAEESELLRKRQRRTAPQSAVFRVTCDRSPALPTAVCVRCKGHCGDFHVERELMQLPSTTDPWAELPDVMQLETLDVYMFSTLQARHADPVH